MFDSRVPNRKRIIRTRLKRHNFGIFQFVIFARRQPCCIFRTKICSKFYPFQVTEFLENRFLVAQGKNGGNPCRIAEYFNTAKTEIRLSKSEFGLLPFGYPAKRINIKIIIYFFRPYKDNNPKYAFSGGFGFIIFRLTAKIRCRAEYFMLTVGRLFLCVTKSAAAAAKALSVRCESQYLKSLRRAILPPCF